MRAFVSLLAALLTGPVRPASELPVVQANDNRQPAGSLRGGILEISLEAQIAAWKPDLRVDSTTTVQVFAERGKSPTIPGPLIRVPLGTEIRASLGNRIAGTTLTVHGLRTGTAATDTFHIAAGETREISFKPAEAGTYLYWGSTSGSAIRGRWGREAQLNGAIVVDPPGPEPQNDRILVLTLVDIFPDSVLNPAKEDVWDLAINGMSWPYTERLHHKVGDTLRWRIINATDRVHPMHLHGFHFRTLAKGDWLKDTTYAAAEVSNAVTEFMLPGSTARLEWTPTRAGNWLFHCHMTPHITPYPERPDSLRAHDSHDVTRHPDEAMAGLVLGIIVSDTASSRPPPPSRHHARIFVQQAGADSGKKTARGFVIPRGATPAKDSIEVPGSPLILYRGERTAVTVVNNLPRPTTIHWHGMELESFFDGVSGWSGVGGSRAPLVQPGDSFTVAFTPPRAGTYIYHTHMDEEDQLPSGLYAPMIVLEPGEKFDPDTDRTFVFGSGIVDGKPAEFLLNGSAQNKPLQLQQGKTYRLRLINIHPVAPATFSLLRDSAAVSWLPLSKDGAELPAPRKSPRRASVAMGVGETYDFSWTPDTPGKFVLRAFNMGRTRFSVELPIIVGKP